MLIAARAEISSRVNKPFDLCCCGLAGIQSDHLRLRHPLRAHILILPATVTTGFVALDTAVSVHHAVPGVPAGNYSTVVLL